jgi:broad specificity phosphatase PhoE
MNIPFDLSHSDWDTARHGMGKRVRHRVVLVRHGESESNTLFVKHGVRERTGNDPDLTASGHLQAQEIACHFQSLNGQVDNIEVSPLKRTIQTALPTIRHFSQIRADVWLDIREKWQNKPYEVVSNLKDVNGGQKMAWTRPSETNEEFQERVASVVDRWKAKGTVDQREHTLVFTHSLFINQVLKGERDTLNFHLANGSFTVIDFDEDDFMHVHFVNHVNHLSKPTGHHTAHFV